MTIKIQFVLVLFCFLTFVTPFMNYNNNNNNNYNGKRRDLKRRCPSVKAIRNFDLESMLGYWYVVQYYASTEEIAEYACIRSHFTSDNQRVTMNFSYVFEQDPLREKQQGNITWIIPDFDIPAHWMHTEDIYEGIYNTYVLDTDYQSWSLIMHCAEKKKHTRYLSALMLSRTPYLGYNVVSYLREKLPRYDIDLSFMFPIKQMECDHLMESANDDPRAYIMKGIQNENDTELIKVLLKKEEEMYL